jgi:hypothetical protein
MGLSAKARCTPGRLLTGSYIVNSSLSKLPIDDQTAAGLHAMATAGYPAIKRIDPKLFTTILSGVEISLGAALLLPVAPTTVAVLGLAAFSGGLLGPYLRSPDMRRQGSLRPTPDGLNMAKDNWMLGSPWGCLLMQ